MVKKKVSKKGDKKVSKKLRVDKKAMKKVSKKAVKKVVNVDAKLVEKIVPQKVIQDAVDKKAVKKVPLKDKRGFFSRLLGIGKEEGGIDEHLPVPQRKSLALIKEKEHAVLKKVNESPIHPEIAKKLEKIDELKKIAKEKVGKKLDKKKEKKGEGDKLNADIKAKNASVLKTKDPTIVTKDGAEFLKTFVPGFDELLNPGIPKGAAVLIEGGPGSGKTLMCLTMLSELCKRGKKVLYMSFEEPEERLRQHINSFGLDAKAYEAKGLLYLKRFNALDIARSVEALLSEAKKELLIDVQPVLIPKEFQPDVVVLDSLSSISSAFSGEVSRFRIYMEQLFRYLEGHNINSFLIREVASPTHIGGATNESGGEAVSFLSDGIIAIYNVIYDNNPRKRALEVLKMRGVNADRRLCEYEIKEHGVIIHSDKTLKGKYKLT
ncbi:MAG: AAA family ATPase [Nanoarchaeota archaeon]|nr:AAA family ATPase [Nanoarchaeota archaeon]